MPAINLHQALARTYPRYGHSINIGGISTGVIISIMVIIFLVMWYVLYQEAKKSFLKTQKPINHFAVIGMAALCAIGIGFFIVFCGGSSSNSRRTTNKSVNKTTYTPTPAMAANPIDTAATKPNSTTSPVGRRAVSSNYVSSYIASPPMQHPQQQQSTTYKSPSTFIYASDPNVGNNNAAYVPDQSAATYIPNQSAATYMPGPDMSSQMDYDAFSGPVDDAASDSIDG